MSITRICSKDPTHQTMAGKFCPECGAPVNVRHCPKCELLLDDTQKFCEHCGMDVQGVSA